MRRVRGQLQVLRQSLVMAILLGLLLVPATCSHAAGPHSIFLDPRGGDAQHHHHGDASPIEQALHHHGHRPAVDVASDAGEIAPDDAAGQPMLHDLPTTMLVTIAATNVTLDIPHLLSLPTADAPDFSRGVGRPAGIETGIEPPPPRAA